MQIEVRFHPEAREEYLDAIAWYLTHSEAIARAFQQEVHEAVDRVRDGPSHLAHLCRSSQVDSTTSVSLLALF